MDAARDARSATDEFIAQAAQQLVQVKALCSRLGLKYVDLPQGFMWVGIAIGFGQTDYTILSVSNSDPNQLTVTGGILKDIKRDLVAALTIVNQFNQNNTSYTVYLHDAEVGWSLLVQRTTPFQVFVDSPAYLNAQIRGLPKAVQELRGEIAEKTELGGQPWSWTAEDQRNLLNRSMI